jgi:hypothetical protein
MLVSLIIDISFLCSVYKQDSHGKGENMKSIATKIFSYKAKDILSFFFLFLICPIDHFFTRVETCQMLLSDIK